VLLAELMLQRTRADLVVPVYREGLARWPTAADLAGAEPRTVAETLRPLGLSHRVSRLLEAAAMCRDGVPRTRNRLLAVPGVGPYAATATLCFAYGRRLAVVDPSVIRVVTRLTGVSSDRSRPRTDPRIWKTAGDLIGTSVNPREWNFAMLDLGAIVCRPKPRCHECPLVRWCPTGRRVATSGGV
jgi:A/G-specific adenine glycosylase